MGVVRQTKVSGSAMPASVLLLAVLLAMSNNTSASAPVSGEQHLDADCHSYGQLAPEGCHIARGLTLQQIIHVLLHFHSCAEGVGESTLF
jgi:hypothetical protein